MIDIFGDLVNFYLIPGLVLGSIYALGAIGLTLTFGILRFANFAHGETMTLGAYFAWSLVQITGWHPIAVLPIAMVLTVLVALGIDRGFY
ncbi:MAG: branched-chain amino acid ABC transporter permease, partial [Alphaproteobacteria bacterium]|nr:branched-chain amino acid ABC transporter permease [Alphaproteobacteria bacterium]